MSKKPYALETVTDINRVRTWKKRALEQAKYQLQTTGHLVSDNLHTRDVGEPEHHSMWGTLFKSPEFTAVAEPAGFTRSARTGGIVTLWVSKESVEDREVAA